MTDLQIGVLLPHFGDDATVPRVVGHAPSLERLGYRSAWVRDNLAYRPHHFEPPGRTFVDGFLTLSAISAATTTLGLGTAVTIPFRPPAVTAQLCGSLCWLAPGRVEFGMGFGSPRPAFEAVGTAFPDRFARCDETLELVRRLGGRSEADDPDDATVDDCVPAIDPAPAADLRIWFGGASDRSLRSALRWCDGLLLARADLTTIATVRERAAAMDTTGREPIRLGTVALMLPGRTHEEALRDVDESRLLDELGKVNRRDYSNVREARGAVLAGSMDDIAAGLGSLADAGAELVVVDLRLTMDRFEEWTTALGEALLDRPSPQVPRTPGSATYSSASTGRADS
ncbi:MAG: LLM class flavin-dependent oxidoreductase [Propionibacteriales bacterium]|nr:LLM class flavin-dependent oxidoreductase [Propionibacteriales bacterium]